MKMMTMMKPQSGWKSALATFAGAWAVAGVAAFGAVGSAHAQGMGMGIKPIRGFVGVGITGGGDKLATVQWSNGESTNIKSGGLVDFRAGVDVRLGDSPFSLVASAGWFSDRVNGTNGSVKFERFPLELMGTWRITDGYRIGLGVRRVGDGKLKGTGAAANIGDQTFTGKVGGLIEGEWLLGSMWGVALRYVSEEYTAPNGVKVDGSHIGVRGTFYF